MAESETEPKKSATKTSGFTLTSDDWRRVAMTAEIKVSQLEENLRQSIASMVSFKMSAETWKEQAFKKQVEIDELKKYLAKAIKLDLNRI